MRWTAPPSAGARSPRRSPPEKRLATIVETYLTPTHRDDPGHGCAVPALGAEIARESPKTRKAFAAKLEQMIDMMADQILDVPRKAARKQAMATLATMMGTMVLSRIAGNSEFSDEILAPGREAVLGRARGRRSRRRRRRSRTRGSLGWAKRSVPTIVPPAIMVGTTLRFAHPTSHHRPLNSARSLSTVS